jgi:hypothetical protein
MGKQEPKQELTVDQREAELKDLERRQKELRASPASLPKLAQPGHKEPEANPVDPRVRIWEPEAWNAHLTAAQAKRGEERNLDCPPGLNKTHTITDKPVVQREWGEAIGKKKPQGPQPGMDAVAEPFKG